MMLTTLFLIAAISATTENCHEAFDECTENCVVAYGASTELESREKLARCKTQCDAAEQKCQAEVKKVPVKEKPKAKVHK